MSWRASAYVKQLELSLSGKRIERGEKLILMVLADYHHDEKDYAEVGILRLAAECLYEKRQLIRNIQSLEQKGFLFIEREKIGTRNETNKYYILGIATPPAAPTAPNPAGQNVTTPSDISAENQGGGSDIPASKMSPIQDKPNEDLNKKKPLSTKVDESEAVKWLFDYYMKKFNRDPLRYTLTTIRKTKATLRLQERLKIHKDVLKAAVADLKHVIDAVAKSDFHREGKYVEWEKHLFRSEEQVQIWLSRAGGGGGPGGKEPLSASERMMEGLK